VHPFWLSHEEKMVLVRALHGRQPWPDLSSMGGSHGGSSERKGVRGGEGKGGGAEGAPWGCQRMRSLFCSVPALYVRKKRRRDRKGKKKRKGKKEKGNFFQT
jgi:hypothetical protein